jgi:signal transduction histidine kinase
MRSLTFKLVLAFILVGLIGAGLVAILVRAFAVRAFDRLVVNRARIEFYDDITALYERLGNWRAVLERLVQVRQNPPPDPLTGEPRSPLRVFPLANQNGRMLIPSREYRRGEQVPRSVLNRALPIEVDGQTVGWVLELPTAPALAPREQQYLQTLDKLIVRAGGAALALALLVGILLASTMTRPLRELTTALRAMAHGQLQQEVPIRSQDELGTLTRAFNQLSADLAQANESRRQMTADIAHDLRTPLTVLSGYVEAMREGVLPPSAERFDTMYVEVQHLQRLVDDLRTLSLADAGELPLNRQSTAPTELIERIAATYRHPAEQAGIEIDVRHVAEGSVARELRSGSIPDVDVDPERMIQVLGNLVSNALRYTPQGGQIWLEARLRPTPDTRPLRKPAPPRIVQLLVQDDGQGIAPDVLPHIFDRFYRGDAARQQQEGESGLGLAIARSIVEAHGGTIDVTSKLGTGTTFTIELPACG